jgi:hypothetical protein
MLVLPLWVGAAAGLEIRSVLPSASLLGKARLTVWGFEVYDAALWGEPGFQAGDYAQHAFALELAYLRDLSGEAIAKRSLDEMRRIGSFTPAQAERWLGQLRSLIPDVKQGDRIVGIHRPGQGAVFYVNTQLAGELRDAAFAPLFFGIWLSPKTSEPKMRQALLPAGTP